MTIMIISCNDPLMWYANMVGQEKEVVREDKEFYWAREPSGCINIIRKNDAEVMAD